MQTGAATVEDRMEVPLKVKNRTTIWPSNSTTRYLPRDYEHTNLKRYMHPYVYHSIIDNSQIVKVSIDRWMDKEDVAYIYNEILPSHKKGNLAICNNMDRSREYNTKWNKSVRRRQIPYDFTHTWNLRNKTKKGQTKKQTPNYRVSTDGDQRAGGCGDGWNRWWGLRVLSSCWALTKVQNCWITILSCTLMILELK